MSSVLTWRGFEDAVVRYLVPVAGAAGRRALWLVVGVDGTDGSYEVGVNHFPRDTKYRDAGLRVFVHRATGAPSSHGSPVGGAR
jgi:hypothetical protein